MTATARGAPEGLPEVTNGIRVLRTMAELTAAEERDRQEVFSNGDRGVQRGYLSLTTVCTDDMLLYKPVRSVEDLINLQSDIDKISHWS